MIQGGDFQYGTGSGGYAASWHGYCNGQAMASDSDCSSASGYTLPDEADNGFNHEPGALSMAKTSQANTGGSQFFIVDKEHSQPHLDGVHTVFGIVVGGSIDGVSTTGIAVVDEISQVVTGVGDRPVYDVTVTKAEIYDDNTVFCVNAVD